MDAQVGSRAQVVSVTNRVIHSGATIPTKESRENLMSPAAEGPSVHGYDTPQRAVPGYPGAVPKLCSTEP